MSKQLLDMRKQKLLLEIECMVSFLTSTLDDVEPYYEVRFNHLNTRRFLQVHVTSVIEASQQYDQAVTAYLAVREEQRKHQVANDAGAMQ